MEISKNKVVTVEYTLQDAEGTVLDTSHGREPLTYIQGTGSMIAGFEAALEGKTAQEKFSFVVEPGQAYGERDETMVFPVPREHFEGIDDLQTGLRLQAQTPQGAMVMTVARIEDQMVTLDANHPMAGKHLHFGVEVLDVRDATEEELSSVRCGEGCSPSCCDTCGSSCGE
jgi:FKBP-type peptidyl-prolyl cis-trans isomerase SlyD